MIPNSTPDVLLLTIQSALKLSGAIQQAYANSVRAREIVLPLPSFDIRPDANTIHQFFSDPGPVGGMVFLEEFPRLRDLDSRFRQLSREEEDEYFHFFRQLIGIVKPDLKNFAQNGMIAFAGDSRALLSLFKVRQWEKGKGEELTPLQLVAGSLVEIGIDYFTRTPTYFSEKNPLGRSLKSFLQGMDDIKLSDRESFRRLGSTILPRLFLCATETLSNFGDQVTADPKFQVFLRETSHKISADLLEHLRKFEGNVSLQLRNDQEEEAVQWGEIVLRSLVKNAGQQFLGNPAGLLRTNLGASNLISATGQVLLDSVLEQPESGGIDLRQAFTQETLDGVLEAGFRVFAEHPSLISGKHGLREIISGVCSSVEKTLAGQIDPLTLPELVPELTRLILHHTAGHLDHLWKVDEEKGEHLLLLAVQEFLRVLAQPVPAGQWRPRLSKSQILGICELLLEDVVQNPRWILSGIEEKSLLGEVLDAVFRTLRQIDPAQRLQVETIEHLIRASLQSIALSERVFGASAKDPQIRKLLLDTLDLVLVFTLDRRQYGSADRIDRFTDLLDYALSVVIARHPGEDRGLVLLQLILFDELSVDYSGGFNRQLADQLMESALRVLATHPELLSRKKALQALVSDLASALREGGYQQPGLLLELLRLVLEATARRADLLLPGADPDRPSYLLVQALRECMLLLAYKPEQQAWKPRLAPEQLLGIAEDLVETAVQQPHWIRPQAGKNTLLGGVLEAGLGALNRIPAGQRLSPAALRHLLQALVQAFARQESQADSLSRELSAKAVDLMLDVLLSKGAEPAQAWEKRWMELVDYLFGELLRRHPDARGLLLADLILREAGLFDQGLDRQLAERLGDAVLEVLDQRPELLTGEPVLQNFIRELALLLREHKQENLLPALAGFGLKLASAHLNKVGPRPPDEPFGIVLSVLRQLLQALAVPEADNGHWRLRLSQEELMDLIRQLFRDLALLPQIAGSEQVLREVLHSVLEALRQLPAEARVDLETLRTALSAALQAVIATRQWVLQVVLENGQLALRYAVEQFFLELYDAAGHPIASWTLTQPGSVQALIEAYLKGLSARALTKETIDHSMNKIRTAIRELEENRGFVLSKLLSALQSRARVPSA